MSDANYWMFKNVLIGPGVKAYYRPWVEGVENIPAEGGAILASNHLSFSDSVFLPLVIKRKVVFLGKAEYFTGKGVKGWATRTFMEGVGTIPVHRGGGRASEAALRTGLQVLQGGDLLGIYPEGTRSPDANLYRGKTGVARLALETGVPVIPCAVIGTDIVAPPGKKFGSITRPVVRFGKPLDFSRYEGMENDRYILRSITDEIMYEIMRLSGQEYVDKYAGKAKEDSKRLEAEARAKATDKPAEPAGEQKKAS